MCSVYMINSQVIIRDQRDEPLAYHGSEKWIPFDSLNIHFTTRAYYHFMFRINELQGIHVIFQIMTAFNRANDRLGTP